MPQIDGSVGSKGQDAELNIQYYSRAPKLPNNLCPSAV